MVLGGSAYARRRDFKTSYIIVLPEFYKYFGGGLSSTAAYGYVNTVQYSELPGGGMAPWNKILPQADCSNVSHNISFLTVQCIRKNTSDCANIA